MEKYLLIIFFAVYLFNFHVSAQSKETNKGANYKHSGNGQQINNTGPGTQTINITEKKTYKVYTHIDKNNKDKILRVDKYIDLNKPIYLFWGSNKTPLYKEQLEDGLYPFSDVWSFYETDTTTLKLKLVGNQLMISGKCFPFDEKPFTISSVRGITNNKINKGYEEYATENSLEITDNRGIPLFQLYLNKPSNTIVINGVFFLDSSCVIMGSNGSTAVPYPPTYKMTEQEKEKVWAECKEAALLEIKPLTEKDLNEPIKFPADKLPADIKRFSNKIVNQQ